MTVIESVRAAEEPNHSAVSLALKLLFKLPWFGWTIAFALFYYYFTKKPIKSTRLRRSVDSPRQRLPSRTNSNSNSPLAPTPRLASYTQRGTPLSRTQSQQFAQSTISPLRLSNRSSPAPSLASTRSPRSPLKPQHSLAPRVNAVDSNGDPSPLTTANLVNRKPTRYNFNNSPLPGGSPAPEYATRYNANNSPFPGGSTPLRGSPAPEDTLRNAFAGGLGAFGSAGRASRGYNENNSPLPGGSPAGSSYGGGSRRVTEGSLSENVRKKAIARRREEEEEEESRAERKRRRRDEDDDSRPVSEMDVDEQDEGWRDEDDDDDAEEEVDQEMEEIRYERKNAKRHSIASHNDPHSFDNSTADFPAKRSRRHSPPSQKSVPSDDDLSGDSSDRSDDVGQSGSKKRRARSRSSDGSTRKSRKRRSRVVSKGKKARTGLLDKPTGKRDIDEVDESSEDEADEEERERNADSEVDEEEEREDASDEAQQDDRSRAKRVRGGKRTEENDAMEGEFQDPSSPAPAATSSPPPTSSRRKQSAKKTVSRTTSKLTRTKSQKDGSTRTRKVGEEWMNAEGNRFRMDADGEKRKLCEVREERKRYKMPKDSLHPDRDIMHSVVVEKWLTNAEYEQAFQDHKLAWQGVADSVPATDAGSPTSTEMDVEKEEVVVDTPRKQGVYYTAGTNTPLRAYGTVDSLRQSTAAPLPRSPSALLPNGRFRLPSSLAKPTTNSPRERSTAEDEAKARAERMRRRQGSVRLGGEVEVAKVEEKVEEKKIQLQLFDDEGKFVGKPFEAPAVAAPPLLPVATFTAPPTATPSLFPAKPAAPISEAKVDVKPSFSFGSAPSVAPLPTPAPAPAPIANPFSAPSAKPVEASAVKPAGGFSFGAPAAPKESSAPITSTLSIPDFFGGAKSTAASVVAPKADSTTSSTMFGSTATAPAAAGSSGFFGGLGASTSGTTTPLFGAASTAPKPPSMFGNPPTSTTTTPAPLPTPSASSAPASRPPAVAAPFSFGNPSPNPPLATPPTTSTPVSSFSFGAPKPPAAAPAMFGAPAPTTNSFGSASATPSMFGQSATAPPATGSPFGQPATTGFGAAPKPAANSPFSFGNSSTPSAPAPSSASSPSFFGAPSTSTPAVAPTSTGFSFGAPSNVAAPPANNSPFGFGSAPTPAAASPFGFGNSTAPASAGGFGSAAPAATGFSFGAGTSTPGGFGQAASGTTTPGGFGSAAPAGFSFGANPGANDAAPADGSAPRRRVTRRLPGR